VAKNLGFVSGLGEGRVAGRELFPQGPPSLPDAIRREFPVSLRFRRRELTRED
jgi:hypothetical protein